MASLLTMRAVAPLAICAVISLGTASLGWAQVPEPEPLIPEEDAPTTTRDTVVAGRDGDMVNARVGVTFNQRSFTLDSTDAGLELGSSLYPTLHIGAEVFPFNGDEGFLGNVGLVGSFARGVDTTAIDEGGVLRKVPTRHSQLDLAVAWRHKLADSLWIQADTGLLLLDFVLAANDFYSSTTYRAWQISTRGVYTISPRFDLQGGIQIFPLVGLGASEAEFGTGSSTFGASGHISVQASVVAGLYVHAGYQLRAFSSSFTGQGDRELDAVVTTDILHSLSLWTGYRF